MDRSDHLEVCKSKSWFEDRTTAMNAASRMSAKHNVRMYWYHCPFCKLYHLTTTQYTTAQRLELMRLALEWEK